MKNVLLIGGLVLIVAIVGIGAFALLNKNGMNTTPSSTAPTSTNEAVSPNSVLISNFSFNPGSLTVKAGTTVTWTNNDSVTHSIKSSSFTSPDLATGDTFKFTFNTPGTYNYNCGIHPTMTGTIIVQ